MGFNAFVDMGSFLSGSERPLLRVPPTPALRPCAGWNWSRRVEKGAKF
jgi:hypothetical protein